MGIPYAEVIGDPIAHSKSPLIHKFWLDKLGIEGDYRAIKVSADDLSAYFASRRADPDWRGCNVTIPHKEAVAAWLDRIDNHGIRAVNCVAPSGGHLTGYNTDTAGVDRAIDFQVDTDKPVCLVGAGGAARAAIASLDVLAGYQFNIVARDKSKAEALLRTFNVEGAVYGFENAESAMVDCAGLINASPLGMSGFPEMPDAILRGVSKISRRGFVLDMVYVPLRTPLLKEAISMHLRAIDGLTILIGQAAPAFEFFFGHPSPPEYDAQLRELLTR